MSIWLATSPTSLAGSGSGDPAGPAARSQWGFSRWELDVPLPLENYRDLAAAFCGALLRGLGTTVDEVVVAERLGVVALPPMPLDPEWPVVGAVALLVPRAVDQPTRAALSAAIRAAGSEGIFACDRLLHLRVANSDAYECRRWVGPSRVWTTVTPWIPAATADDAAALRCSLLEDLSVALFDQPAGGQIENIVAAVDTRDEPWLEGLPAAGARAHAEGGPTHVRIEFRAPVEGPLRIGSGRLSGMGLLAPR